MIVVLTVSSVFMAYLVNIESVCDRHCRKGKGLVTPIIIHVRKEIPSHSTLLH